MDLAKTLEIIFGYTQFCYWIVEEVVTIELRALAVRTPVSS
jgi:hypothetical protein